MVAATIAAWSAGMCVWTARSVVRPAYKGRPGELIPEVCGSIVVAALTSGFPAGNGITTEGRILSSASPTMAGVIIAAAMATTCEWIGRSADHHAFRDKPGELTPAVCGWIGDVALTLSRVAM